MKNSTKDGEAVAAVGGGCLVAALVWYAPIVAVVVGVAVLVLKYFGVL